MLSKYGRQMLTVPVAYLVSWLKAWGVTPNALTFTGFILTVASALLLAWGSFFWGGLLLFLAAMFDLLDGSLARATEQSSLFGAFLDSTLDRYAESVTLLGLVYFYAMQPDAVTELVLLFAILVGSMMVSYTRARAEGLQIECKAGILQRPERVLLLILGLLTGWMLPTLWLLAIFANVTALQRIYEVYWRTHQRSQGATNNKMVNTEQ